MIIKNQFIEMKWTTRNKKYFEDKGYKFTKKFDTFNIKLEDLQLNSNKNIKCICDYCNEEFDSRFSIVSKYLNSKDTYKLACNKCTHKKIKDTNLERYGVEVPIQSKKIQEKIKNTCLNKYGVEYSGQSKTKKEKTKQTNLERYGVEYNLQRKDIRDKIKKTNLEKYGFENPMQNKLVQQKMIKTNLKKYGVKYTWQNEKVKDRIKETNLEKYGVEYNLQNKNIRKKIEETNFRKYGVKYPMQNKRIKNKMIFNNLKKYGVKYTLQDKIVREKINKSLYMNGTAPCSKQQKHLHDLLDGELNYPIGRCLLDIAFPNEMIYIEYDGSGHDLQVKLGNITIEKFKQNEINRQYFLKNKGWKIIRIISRKDKLLTDNEFLELINNAKNYLTNSDHTWVEIDIDNRTYNCKEKSYLF